MTRQIFSAESSDGSDQAPEKPRILDRNRMVCPMFLEREVLAKDIVNIRVMKVKTTGSRKGSKKQVDWSALGEDPEAFPDPFSTTALDLERILPPGKYWVDAQGVETGRVIAGTKFDLIVTDHEEEGEEEEEPEEEEEEEQEVQRAQVVQVAPPRDEVLARMDKLNEQLLQMAQQSAVQAQQHAREMSELTMKHAQQQVDTRFAAMEAAASGTLDNRQQRDALVDELRRELDSLRKAHRDELDAERADRRNEARRHETQIDEVNKDLRNALSKSAADLDSITRKHRDQLDELLKDQREEIRRLSKSYDEEMRAKRDEWAESRKLREREHGEAYDAQRKRIADLEAEIRTLRGDSFNKERELVKENIDLERKIVRAGKENSSPLMEKVVGGLVDMAPGAMAFVSSKIEETKAQVLAQQQQAQQHAQVQAAAAEAERQAQIQAQRTAQIQAYQEAQARSQYEAQQRAAFEAQRQAEMQRQVQAAKPEPAPVVAPSPPAPEPTPDRKPGPELKPAMEISSMETFVGDSDAPLPNESPVPEATAG